MGAAVEQGTKPWRVGGVTVFREAGFIRPADTTQYTANDVVSNSTTATTMMQFKDCVREDGGTGVLYSGLMFDSVAAATKPNFDLALFDTSNLTLAADNAAGTITDNQVLRCVAVITFDGTNAANVCTVGPNLIIGASGVAQGFKCAANSRDLWGVVIDRGGYTPSSAETFNFKIAISQD